MVWPSVGAWERLFVWKSYEHRTLYTSFKGQCNVTVELILWVWSYKEFLGFYAPPPCWSNLVRVPHHSPWRMAEPWMPPPPAFKFVCATDHYVQFHRPAPSPRPLMSFMDDTLGTATLNRNPNMILITEKSGFLLNEGIGFQKFQNKNSVLQYPILLI